MLVKIGISRREALRMTPIERYGTIGIANDIEEEIAKAMDEQRDRAEKK